MVNDHAGGRTAYLNLASRELNLLSVQENALARARGIQWRQRNDPATGWLARLSTDVKDDSLSVPGNFICQ